MPEVPDYFQYQLEHPREEGSGLYRFSYDDATQTFLIGKTSLQVSEFDPYLFSSLQLDNEKEEAIDLHELADQYALLPDWGGVIGCPKLHVWTWENPEALEPTRKVMHRALTAVIENPETIIFDDSDEHGFMGYAVGNRESDDRSDGLRLQVFGNCACMERGLYGIFPEGIEHGFGQYDLHNADLPAQRAGLYAGLGHLAKLAAEADSRS